MPIIWLDSVVHEADENAMAQKKLKKLTKLLIVFDDEELCEKYIRQLALSEKVIFIVSGSIGKVVLPVFHDLVQLTVILIYAAKQDYYEKKFKSETYPKASTTNIICFYCKNAFLQRI